MAQTQEQRKRTENSFLEVGIWLLFFALLVPAGFTGYVIGTATSHSEAHGHARVAHAVHLMTGPARAAAEAR